MKNVVLTCLLASLLAFAGPAPSAPAQQAAPAAAQTSAAPGKGRRGEIFVIQRNAAGESVCRVATPQERARMTVRVRSGKSVVIYPGGRLAGEADKDGATSAPQFLSTGQMLQPSAGLRIVLHASDRLAANTTVSNAFRVAANRWEAVISTPITVVLDVDFGEDFFEEPGTEYDPGIIGVTSSAELTKRYQLVRQRLIANSPEAAEATLYNALTNEPAVPVEINGQTTGARYVKLTTPVARALGLEPDITNPETVPDFGGDAGIGFNSNQDFDFNPDNGIGIGLLDFDATAVHEIGHALGFVSDSGDGTEVVLTLLDLFRLRPGTALASNISTVGAARRVMSEGGPQVFFSNRTNTFGTNETALSTGGSDGQGGDGAQSSHWRDDDLGPFIGLMDPTLSDGVREVLTANDRLAFDQFGYKLAPVAAPAPPPLPPAQPPANNNFASAFALHGSRGTTVGDNIDATAQAGEPDPSGDSIDGVTSVWFTWTAPASGPVTFDTVGSGYDTTLGAYTGSAVNALTPAGPNAENDDIDPGIDTDSTIDFMAAAGQTYRIMVNGWRSSNGGFKLRWSGVTSPSESVFDFSQANYTVPEHDRAVGVVIRRTGNTAGQQSITLNAVGSNGTLSGTGPVLFAPGETFKVVPLTLTDDPGVEPTHLIALSLEATQPGAVVGSVRPTATLTVTDDDTFPANSVQFAGATTKTVGESAGQIDIQVTRTGTLTQDAFVDYRTSDGTALDTKDYIFAGGTLHFAAGEASKTVTVLVNQDFFDDEAETFQLTLSNPLRTGVAGPPVTVQIVDDDPPGLTTNPNDLTPEFVTQHYKDFLNRSPDAGGLGFWSQGIEDCGANAGCRQRKRRDTSAAFFLSIEFQETGYLVYRMYKAAYGDIDPPTNVPVPVRFREFMTDTQEMARGLVVGPPGWETEMENNKRAVVLDFVSRGRFKAEHPPELTPAQFVDALNANAGGVLTAAERTAAINEFGGAATIADANARARALRRVADDQTLRDQEFRRAFVLMQYFGYMRRDPDDGQDINFNGFFFWLGKLNDNNGDWRRAEMVRAFIESIEYRQRFGQ